MSERSSDNLSRVVIFAPGETFQGAPIGAQPPAIEVTDWLQIDPVRLAEKVRTLKNARCSAHLARLAHTSVEQRILIEPSVNLESIRSRLTESAVTGLALLERQATDYTPSIAVDERFDKIKPGVSFDVNSLGIVHRTSGGILLFEDVPLPTDQTFHE